MYLLHRKWDTRSIHWRESLYSLSCRAVDRVALTLAEELQDIWNIKQIRWKITRTLNTRQCDAHLFWSQEAGGQRKPCVALSSKTQSSKWDSLSGLTTAGHLSTHESEYFYFTFPCYRGQKRSSNGCFLKFAAFYFSPGFHTIFCSSSLTLQMKHAITAVLVPVGFLRNTIFTYEMSNNIALHT